ncbi:MAG: exosortase [Gammaproteobacteria bacterium]|nr:exosortase [Gammaproteobacteria bacterium]
MTDMAGAAPAQSLLSGLGWVAFGGLVVLLVGAAYPSLESMVVNEWFGTEEYSHGVLVPLIAAYLVRQRASVFEQPGRQHLIGVLLVALGMVFVLVGSLSTIHVVAQYGFLIGLLGAVAATFGADVLRRLALPLLVLVFMIPLPNFFYQPLSSQLQLLSSVLGVEVIRLFGVSVLLQGNVIDLGTYQLQVAEACNGLRYLFPLASLGYLCGYLYRGPVWQRLVLVAASVPITILLNSFRIGVIGITVEHWGIAAAEGFLHDFEGWVVFMVCVVLLFCVAKLLQLVGGQRGPLRDRFETTLPVAPSAFLRPTLQAPWAVGLSALVVIAAIVVAQLPAQGSPSELAPRRSLPSSPCNWTRAGPARVSQSRRSISNHSTSTIT